MKLKSDIQDVFRPDPGHEEPVECGVCGATMIVHRDQHGPTSSVAAMAGTKRHHDYFECPLRQEEWHRKVIAIRSFMKQVPSDVLCDLMREEADQILELEWGKRKGVDPQGHMWLLPRMHEDAVQAVLEGNTSGISTERPG